VNAPTEVTVPFTFERTKSFSPTVPAGVVNVNDVAVFVPLVTLEPPRVAVEFEPKLVPVTTVVVPPAIGPEVTESDVIVGGAK
jgi:hypothetical protein